MKIYMASDHAGYDLKEYLKVYLKKNGYECEDVGPYKYDELDDYPDFIIPAAKKVSENLKENKGIILGGSGQGEAIAANKVNGIRAAVYNGGPIEIVELSKKHNDANILSLGARFISKDLAKKVVKIWLETEFSGEERHIKRIDKISKFEDSFQQGD